MRESLQSLMKQAAQVLAADAPVTPQQAAARKWPFAKFVAWAWPLVEPTTPLVWSWHLTAVCDHLQALLEGRLGKQNLLITIPPGTGKSTLTSVCLPAWWWIRNPSWRATFASGNPTVAVRDSIKCRTILDSERYKRTFGTGWSFSEDQNQKMLYENSASGFRQATTCGARVTGSRPHALFTDDALDAAESNSKASRDAVNSWWDLAYANRLADLQTGTRVVIGQRLHPEDLPGHILATEPQNWVHLMIPMCWEESRRFTTPLGWTDPRTADNQLLFPERFPQSVIDTERTRLGSSGFAGQHQQRPTAAEGELFKRGGLRLIDPAALPPFLQVVIALDCAYSTKTTADYSAVVVMGQCDAGLVILDVIATRVAYPQLRALTEQLAEKWHPLAVLIENAASGRSLVQSLQQETNLPVVPIEVVGDKVARATTVTPAWEAGRIFAPQGAAWLDAFLAELYDFPKSAHDDMTDAFTMAVRYCLNAPGHGLLEYYRGELKAEQATAATTPAVWPHPSQKMLERVKREGAIAVDAISPWHLP